MSYLVFSTMNIDC